MGSGGGFGVVLDRERGDVDAGHPLERAVVEVLMGGKRRTKVSLDGRRAAEWARPGPIVPVGSGRSATTGRRRNHGSGW